METTIARFFELGGLCAALYLFGFCYRGVSWPKTILKTTSVVALAVVAIVAQAPYWLPLALVVCAAGDYFLSRGSETDFIKGVGAFAIGHVFYIALFLTDPMSSVARISNNAQVATLSALITIAVIMLIWLWFRAGDLRYAVVGYIVIITAMGISAASLPWQDHYGSILLGVMFFIISDLTLSAELLIFEDGGKAQKRAPFIVWTFYWLAQLLITAGFVLSTFPEL